MPNQPTPVRIKVRDHESREITGAEVKLVLSAGGTNMAAQPASFDRAAVTTYLEGWYETEFGQKASVATGELISRKQSLTSQ